QLGRRGFRIKIAENTVHAGSRKCDVVLKRSVRPRRMIVHEEAKIAADNERVKELLVNDRELLDPLVLPRVEYLERQMNGLVRRRRLRRDGEIQMVFGR